MRSRKKSKRYLETNEKENTTTPNLWDTGSNPKRKIHSITCLYQEIRTISNKESDFSLKGT